MKVKADFVTNSSSTSFIVTCKAEAGEIDDFINKFNELLKNYIKKSSWDGEFQEPSMLTSDRVTKVGSGTFLIQDFVPIYCGEQDTPQYLKDFFVDRNPETLELLKQAGIAIISIEAKNLNEPQHSS